MNNGDRPAMPIPNKVSGLTKREHFTGLAMQGILSNSALVDVLNDDVYEWVSIRAARIADAQLAELEGE